VIGEEHSRSPANSARLWAFVGSAFVLSPLSCYGFAAISRQSILLGIPVVAILLLGLSSLFGLWGQAFGALVKFGVVLWVVVMACLSPAMLFVAMTYYCAYLNGQSGHYVCGL
jgi:hypothetical protein